MKKAFLILLLLVSACDAAPDRAAANANLIVPTVQSTRAVSITMVVNGAVVPNGGSYDYRNTVVQYLPLVKMGDGSTNQRVNYTSSAPDVATVNANGYLIATRPGSATITATSIDDPHASTSLTVNVIAPTSADTLATINTAKPVTNLTSGNGTSPIIAGGGSGSSSGSGSSGGSGGSGGSSGAPPAPTTSSSPRY